MEDLAVPDRPAMPGVSPGTLRRGVPYLITWRERHSVGWRVARRNGPCFVVARVSRSGNEKVLDRFPLTEEGWTLAWAALVSLDTDAARAIVQVLKDRDRQAHLFETLAHGGPVTKFSELGVQILAGDRAVYTIGSHDSIAKTDSSRLLGPLAGAKAMVPDFIEMGFLGGVWQDRTMAAHAAVVLPNGTIRTIGLDGHGAVRQARKQVAQFNTAASAAAFEETGSAARGDPPAMPSVSPGDLMRFPVLITGRRRHNIGWQDTRRDGPCFVVTRTSVMGNDKVVDRFPLTESGWAMAWTALVDLDVGAARAAAQSLHDRLAANAARAGRREQGAYEVFARAASVTTFSALGVQIPAGDEAVYTIGSHDSAKKTNSSRRLGQLAGAKAMVPMKQPITFDAIILDGIAAVVFRDGAVHRAALTSRKAVRAAREQVAQFNALASAIATTGKETRNDPDHQAPTCTSEAT